MKPQGVGDTPLSVAAMRKDEPLAMEDNCTNAIIFVKQSWGRFVITIDRDGYIGIGADDSAGTRIANNTVNPCTAVKLQSKLNIIT